MNQGKGCERHKVTPSKSRRMATISALPPRATRGKRLEALLANEDDDEFYNQQFFASSSDDDAFGTTDESEEEDVVDDDFHDDESDESEREVVVRREKEKKTLKAPERQRVRTTSMWGATTTTTTTEDGDVEAGNVMRREGSARARRATGYGARDGGANEASENKEFATNDDGGRKEFAMNEGDGGSAREGGGGVVEARRTKRATAQMILEQSERMRAERAAKPAPGRAKVEHREWTQEELLEEAKETEYWNTIDLQRLLTLEAEMKKKVPTGKTKYEGPSILYKSSAKVNSGTPVIELLRGAETPEPLRQPKPTPHVPSVCAITGLPAKYKDPLTGQPYATIEAFKELRLRHDAAKSKDVDMESEKKPDVARFPTSTAVRSSSHLNAANATSAKKRSGVPSSSKYSNVPLKMVKEEVMIETEV